MGKGRAPVLEEVWGEVTGVVCDLCDKKGIPCRWRKVSIPTYFSFSLLILVAENSLHLGLPWLSASPGQVPCGESKARSQEVDDVIDCEIYFSIFFSYLLLF